jgi:hypothetical protein
MAYFIVRPQYKKGVSYILDPVLNNNSWEAIQWAAQNGVASSTWSVGDRKAITLNGTVGAKTFSNTTVYAYILGFNHNASVEGNDTIHFQFGFDSLTGGNHIAFCDSYYGDTGSTSAFRMNTSSTNSGGWSGSYMRNTIMPAFINAMPSDLQSALKEITKYTDNTGNGGGDVSSYVTATQDKVFLLAEYEIFGTRSYANSYEQNSQKQYDYYKNANAKIMYNDTSTSSAVIWWERSPHYTNSVNFCSVNSSGNASSYAASRSRGFAPAFVVG